MRTNTYPSLGQRVNFIRQGVGTEAVEGSGIIQGIFLDPSRRVMVNLETDEVNEVGKKVRRSVHVTCLSSSEEFKAAFKASLETVEKLAEEGNSKSREIVAEYNQRVDEAQRGILGAEVVFDA